MAEEKNSSIRILSKSDDEIVSKFLESNHSLFKINDPQAASNLLDLINSNHAVVLGYFENEELRGTINAYRWQSLPYYTIQNLKITPDKKGPSQFKKVSSALIGEINKIMESEKRFTFYYAAILRGLAKSQLKDENSETILYYRAPLRRYHTFVETIVPAGTISPYTSIRHMLADRIFPIDIWIRVSCLKQEFRKLY